MNKALQKGFTLMEVIVVMAIFLFIIISAATILVSVIKGQRQILQEQELLAQGSYAQDYISRALRAAVKDVAGTCTSDGVTPNPGGQYFLTHYNSGNGEYQGIKFINKDAVCQEFYFDTNTNTLNEVKNGGTPQNLISNNFTIEYAAFILNGNKTISLASESNGLQPRVTFAISMRKPSGTTFVDRVFQTSISQRNINLLP